MPILSWLYRHTFNSVPFGIAVLVAIGLYVAVGSGMVGLREWLEMDEMLFFNWWPLKLLAALLVINLTIVTVTRIPLTPPRYGVWTIHMGIILLVLSVSAYYAGKTEGYMPLVKGQTSESYYDRWERALYVRTSVGTGRPITLPGLPRFREYDAAFGNADYLDRPALRNLQPQVTALEARSNQSRRVPLHEVLGLKEPVFFDIVGYYPYAEVQRWSIDPTVKNVGLKVRPEAGAHDANANPDDARWLVASGGADAVLPIGPAALEHRHLPTKADIDIATGAAKRLHKLGVRVGDTASEAFVEPGEKLDVGDSGYEVRVEGFTPAFQLSSGEGTADVLTVLITQRQGDAVVREFRRTVLSNAKGKPGEQTDFELNVEGAGPFGKRKRDGLLDDAIQLTYAFTDPTKLLPSVQETTVKYILFTADDAPGITMLRVSSREASESESAEQTAHLTVSAPGAMFSADAQPQEIAHLHIERFDHVAQAGMIQPTPKAQRQRDVAASGSGQVVRVRIRSGTWSTEVPVKYHPFADRAWLMPGIKIPGASSEVQLMLGNQPLRLPVDVRLDQFEAVPYAGGEVALGSFMRDFKSTITIFDRESGASRTTSASLNEPAFFTLPPPAMRWLLPSQSWLLSQSSWDPSNLDYTVLQVGNRPAVGTMTAACVMIFGGLLYAFYARPVIVRRMKANALRKALAKKEATKATPHEANVPQPV